MLKNILYLTIVCLLGSVCVYAQQLQPKGYFLTDSVRLGEYAHFSLSFRHPHQMEVLFPDSSFDFKPFEWVDKTYFSTKSDSSSSFDSVVYTVRTFEMDTVQHLSVPVYVISKNGDTTQLDSRKDSVILSFLLTSMPDSIKLKADGIHLPVKRAFNYPFFTAAIVFLVLLLLLVWVFFGEKIKNTYRLRRLRKQYELFTNSFDSNLKQAQNEKNANHALVIWKAYLENLKSVPFSSLTTKEITSKFPNKELKNALKNIDMAVYGGVINEHTQRSLQYLKNFADSAYEEQLKHIKNT